MAKCISCNQRKGKRLCPSLDEYICTNCCGAKRNNEIECHESCPISQKGEVYNMDKEIRKIVKKSFNRKSEDIFQNEELVFNIFQPLEKFIFENSYNDKSKNDDILFDALSKIYYVVDEKINEDQLNEFESSIYLKFKSLIKDFQISIDIQKKCILRIMKSIDSTSGGRFGNRNYLELLKSQFSKTGKWSKMFNSVWH